MVMNRLQASLWSAALYLIGVALLAYVVQRVATLFGLLPDGVEAVVVMLVGLVVPIVGTVVYLDWQWGWKLDNVGAGLTPKALGWAGLGLVLGGAAAILAHGLSVLLSGSGPLVSLIPALSSPTFTDLLKLAVTLCSAFVVELIFRGVIVSRFQADLANWQLLGAALLTPFTVLLFHYTPFGPIFPWPEITSVWTAAMSVCLTMLYLRVDSVWFVAGLRGAMMAALAVLPLRVTEAGALAVWGTAALILLVLTWLNQQRMPRRIQPRGSSTHRGRVHRGPWGPH